MIKKLISPFIIAIILLALIFVLPEFVYAGEPPPDEPPEEPDEVPGATEADEMAESNDTASCSEK